MVCEAAESPIGYIKMHNNNRPDNEEVENLSRKQKELRIKLSNCNDTGREKVMKTGKK